MTAARWGLVPLPLCSQQPVTLETVSSSRPEFVHLQNHPKGGDQTTDSVSPPSKTSNSFLGGWACHHQGPALLGEGSKPEAAPTLNEEEESLAPPPV